MLRAAEGVISGYETLSTFDSGRVKHASSPEILTLTLGIAMRIFTSQEGTARKFKSKRPTLKFGDQTKRIVLVSSPNVKGYFNVLVKNFFDTLD